MSFRSTFLLKIVCCFTAATVSGVFGQQDIRATLYEQFGNSGMSVSIDGYVPDLSTLGFADRARSACTVGMWIFYAMPNYGYGSYHVVATYSDSPFCFDFDIVAADVSSVRYVGSGAGLSVQTFTLYEQTYFARNEEYITSEKPALNLANVHGSIILTGGGNWTVFEGTSYSGPSACLASTGTGVVVIADIRTVGLEHNSLRSVRIGCETNPKTVVHLQSSMTGHRSFSP
ncbi:unnamed protein product [Orchesella dallaii]|uniref:Beta/gamma crystallin 'Greek key' domain-containing protein n=1 Tax=Orchesella dallaii TaxID=48710 RepID=A0ABP1RK55_9HEXA